MRDVSKEDFSDSQTAKTSDTAWLVSGSLTTVAGSLTGRGLQVGSQITLARLLGPATFGLYTIGWACLKVGMLVFPLGLDTGVIHCGTQWMRKDEQRFGRILGESVAFSALFGTLFAVAIFVETPAIANRIFGSSELVPVIRLFAIAFPVASALRVASASTTVSHSMKYSVYSEMLSQPGANLVLIVVFYWMGLGLMGAVAAAVISFGFGLILAIKYQRRLFPQIRYWARPLPSPVSPQLLKFSLVSWLGVVFVNLIPWVDRLFVAAYLRPKDVGIYQAAAQCSLVLGIVAAGFNSVVAPRISFLFQKAQTERLTELYQVASKWMFYVSVPLFLLLCCASRQLLTAVYGIAYVGGAQPLLILSVMWLLDGLAGPVGILLTFTGRQGRFSVISGGGLILSIVLNYLLIPRFGISGAAVATAFADIALLAALLLAARDRSGSWPFDRRWLKGMVAAAVTAALLWILRPMDVRPAALGLILTLVSSVTLFAVGLMILGLDAEDRELVKILRGLLTPQAEGS